MSVRLYEHQKKAVSAMKNGCILCGDVGSGKSRTALAYFYTKVCDGKLPSKTNGFSKPTNMKDIYVITTARKRTLMEWEEEALPFLIADRMKVDSWNNIKKYSEVENAFFIFDEQRLVGNGTWVKTFLKIASKNQWIVLSATPGDVWMDYVPIFIANGFYRNRTEFVKQHVVYNRFSKYPKVDRYLNVKHLEKLKRSILVAMPYEKKSVRHSEWIKVGFDEKLYDMVNKNRWNIYNNLPIENASELCYALRKVVNSDLRRVEAVSNILKNHPKVIIFYNFDYELELLRDYCEKTHLSYSEWNGHKHERIPEGSSWAYLVQYTAGCEGWNCITTDTIIFYSQNYSYKAVFQAMGRIDRMNTPYIDLYYYHIFSDSSIDKGIRWCLKRKKAFNEKNFVAS